MEKYIPKSDVVAEIKRISCENPMDNSWYVDTEELLSFLNTLEVKEVREEPVSKDLEEAVNAYIGYAPEVDECSSVHGKRQAFKAGAKWMEQRLKDR